MLYAETTDMTKTAILRFPISLEEATALLPPNTSAASPPTAGTFADAPVVLVEETAPPPTPEFGSELQQSAINDAGTWRQQWTIVSLTLAEAKRRLVHMARDVLRARMDTRSIAGAEVLTFMELRDYEAGHTANIPILTQVRAFRGGTVAATAAYMRGRLDDVANRAAQLIPRYLDGIDRIQAASTIDEAKAIYDEIEALS